MPGVTHKLGRVPSFDAKSLAYPMRSWLPPSTPWAKRVWTPGPILDQDETSHCVAFATVAELNATPVTDDDKSAAAHAFFEQVKAQDVAMGNVFREGATTLAGVKAAMAAGRISAYFWGYTVNDVVDCLVRKGPVILGTTWYDDMFEPAESGLVRPRGAYAGGHCYLALGYWPAGRLPGITDPVIECQNSWGRSWGKSGRFYLSLNDLDTLLGQYGEAVIATDSRLAPVELV